MIIKLIILFFGIVQIYNLDQGAKFVQIRKETPSGRSSSETEAEWENTYQNLARGRWENDFNYP